MYFHILVTNEFNQLRRFHNPIRILKQKPFHKRQFDPYLLATYHLHDDDDDDDD